MKDLFIGVSLYSLFLYTLINNNWQKSHYVLSDRIPLVIHKQLRSLNIEVYTQKTRQSKKLIDKIINRILNNWDYLKYIIYSKNIKYNNIYGNDEFFLSFKYRNKGINLIEDGPFNKESEKFFKKRQVKQEQFLINYWLYWRWRKYLPYGYDNSVKTIYHTQNIELPQKISSKGITIDIKDLWEHKSESQKLDILKLFDISSATVKKLNSCKSVLVTQILPISDEEKIHIYKKMLLDNNIEESDLLIKTHYAEKTRYKNYFPKAQIIDKPVPFQLFDLLGYLPQNILTISSSAITTFIRPNTNIVFLGTEIDKRIVELYGIVKLDDLIGNNSSNV